MNVITDDINKVVQLVRAKYTDGSPYYEFGHRLEIANLLLKKDTNSTKKYEKYPLIALRLPTAETIADEMAGQGLNIVIVTLTKKDYTTAQRYEKVFKPILYPLYYRFFDALRASGKFTWKEYGKMPQHTKTDKPFWGVTGNEGNAKYIFNDPLDAIEITNLKINQHLKPCI